jgi:hypothetical protein
MYAELVSYVNRGNSVSCVELQTTYGSQSKKDCPVNVCLQIKLGQRSSKKWKVLSQVLLRRLYGIFAKLELYFCFKKKRKKKKK